MKTQIAAVQFVFAGEVAGGINMKLSEMVVRNFFNGDITNDMTAEDVYGLLTSEATDLAFELLTMDRMLGITSKYPKQKDAVVAAMNRLVMGELSNLAKPFVQKRTVEGLAEMKIGNIAKEYISALVGKPIKPAAQKPAESAPVVVGRDTNKDREKEHEATIRNARQQVMEATSKDYSEMTEAEIIAAQNAAEDARNAEKAAQEALKAAKAQDLARSSAAQRILAKGAAAVNNQGGGAAQAPAKPQGNGTRRMLGQSAAQRQAHPATNNQNNGGNVQMDNTQTQGQGTSRRLAPGAAQGNFASVGGNLPRTGTSRRLSHDAFERQEFVKYEGPWYLNRTWYPNVMEASEFAAARKNEALGITGFKYLNPADVLQNPPMSMLAIVEVQFGAGVKFEFSIFESTQAESKEPIYSGNIGMNSFVGRQGRTVYNRHYRFSAPYRNEEGKIEGYDNILVTRGLNMDENVFAQVMTLAHWAEGFEA